MPDKTILTIGTKKGLFVAESTKSRRGFKLRGPFGEGVGVYSSLIDTRGSTPLIFASSCNAFFGMKVLRSNDLGNSFRETKSAPSFPRKDGRALQNIWALEPGNGGLCMHTILRDGNRVHLGISTGGHYLSEDGGETFNAANTGIGAGFIPNPFPEFGQCVHKIVGHKDVPGRLYMQNHGGWSEWDGPGGPRPDIGVLRSDDHGHTWYSIAKGLPFDFGFPICVHAQNPDVVYVLPLDATTRTCPGARPAVWRSENGGRSWKRLTNGLPRRDAYHTVLRDAMDVDENRTPLSTTAPPPARCGWDATVERNGNVYSIPCHRSTV